MLKNQKWIRADFAKDHTMCPVFRKTFDVNNIKISLNVFVQNGKINIIEIINTNLPQELKLIIENISKELQNSPVTYVTSLSSDYNQEIDLSTIITAIEQKINCKWYIV